MKHSTYLFAWIAAWTLLVTAPGCGGGGGGDEDSGTGDDSGTMQDSGTGDDSGTAEDSGTVDDAGTDMDAGGDDAGTPDDGGATDGASDDGGGADGAGGDGGVVGCSEYCTTIMANCTGDDAQYADMDACMTYCGDVGNWNEGTAGDTDGNSVACRTTHAGLAATDSATHCPHAGPTGADTCGAYCDVYCTQMANTCTGDNEQYANRGACMTACGEMSTDGSPNDTDGDTLQCRIYHGGLLALDDPATHCPHAGEDGDGVCVD